MNKICQGPYQKIAKQLRKAREAASDKSIRRSLKYFGDALIQLAETSRKKPLIFSEFVYDPAMIFKNEQMQTVIDEVDVTITTDGLLAQLLAAINICEPQRLSDKIKTAIETLHSQLSKGNDGCEKEYTVLKVVLSELIHQCM